MERLGVWTVDFDVTVARPSAGTDEYIQMDSEIITFCVGKITQDIFPITITLGDRDLSPTSAFIPEYSTFPMYVTVACAGSFRPGSWDGLLAIRHFALNVPKSRGKTGADKVYSLEGDYQAEAVHQWWETANTPRAEKDEKGNILTKLELGTFTGSIGSALTFSDHAICF